MEESIEERTGAAKAIVPSKKKEIYEERRIVGCYEWVRPDESLSLSDWVN